MDAHTALCFGGSQEIRIKQARWGVLCQVLCAQEQPCPSLARREAVEG